MFLKHYEPICRYMATDWSTRFKNNKIRPSPIHYYHHISESHRTKYQICYFDFEVDTLYLGPSSSGQLLSVPCQAFTATSIKPLARIPGMSRLRFMVCEERDWLSSSVFILQQSSTVESQPGAGETSPRYFPASSASIWRSTTLAPMCFCVADKTVGSQSADW